MKLPVATLAVAASLAGAAPAAADTFTVTGLGDAGGASCIPTGTPGDYQCSTLRAAVQQANANGALEDQIGLAAGSYELTQGSLQITSPVVISGPGARQTTLSLPAGADSVFRVHSGGDLTLGLLTVRGGTNGVAIDSGASAWLSLARVTGATDVGIQNRGSAGLAYSLVDGNGAGGIRSLGIDGEPTDVTVGRSTIAANNGPGISSPASVNSLSLIHATIARNVGAGLNLQGGPDAFATASIIAANGGSNCAGGVLTGTLNVEDTTSCALSPSENRVDSDPLLSPALVDAGGHTDVLTIPADSPAADSVSPCSIALDQRAFSVPEGQSCDAGAYDHKGVDPGFQPVPPPPVPPPPSPTPSPTPSPQPPPTPAPVVNRTAVVREQSGTVKVQLPGTKTFVDLDAARGIPMGSTIDARKGAVAITSVPKAGAPPETAVFKDGLFKLTQSKGITNLTLVEPLACSKRASAAQKGKKVKKRKLWGDGKGSFRTTGRYSAATVRGTKWLVEDTCTSTLTRVAQGSVTVTHGKKRIVVRAGKRYIARARK